MSANSIASPVVGLIFGIVLNSCVFSPADNLTKSEIGRYLAQFRQAYLSKNILHIKKSISQDLTVTTHYYNSLSFSGSETIHSDYENYLVNTKSIFDRTCQQRLTVTTQTITVGRDKRRANVETRTRYLQRYAKYTATVEVLSRSELRKQEGKIKLMSMNSNIRVLNVVFHRQALCEPSALAPAI